VSDFIGSAAIQQPPKNGGLALSTEPFEGMPLETIVIGLEL
jgi:hypothetical protein